MSVARFLWAPAAEIAGRLRALPRAAEHPLERDEALRPFFIVGSGRSGNTLLRRILQDCPGVFIPSELPALGEAIRTYRRNRVMPWPELVRSVLAPFAFDSEFARFGPPLPELAESLARLPVRERSLARILDAVVMAHAGVEADRFERWGDKTPLQVFSLEPLRSVFPRARFVHVLRDGVDVAASYVAAGLQPDLASAARRWQTAVRSARVFAARHPARCIEVRYEALVSQPWLTVGPLLDFLDLELDPAALSGRADTAALPDAVHHTHLGRVLEPIDETSIGRGRRSLGPDELALLERLLGRDLLAAGYPPARD